MSTFSQVYSTFLECDPGDLPLMVRHGQVVIDRETENLRAQERKTMFYAVTFPATVFLIFAAHSLLPLEKQDVAWYGIAWCACFSGFMVSFQSLRSLWLESMPILSDRASVPHNFPYQKELNFLALCCAEQHLYLSEIRVIQERKASYIKHAETGIKSLLFQLFLFQCWNVYLW